MSSEKIYNAITQMPDNYIHEAMSTKLKNSHSIIMRFTAIAASLALVVGIGGYLLLNMNNLPQLPIGGSTGGSGHTDGSTEFMSYAGPVFPMTLVTENDSIAAERRLVYDFSEFGAERQTRTDLHPAEIRMLDEYTLTNRSASDITVDVLYPFVGNFAELGKLVPSLSLNGTDVNPTLFAGAYSGGFSGIGYNDEETTHNLDPLNSWEEYKAILSNGEYLKQALSDYSELNQTVTFYEFKNAVADHSKAVNPTLAARFDIDYEKSTVLAYGFHGGHFDFENGTMMQSFSIPKVGDQRYGNSFYLVVIGEDVSNLVIQGYINGGCEDGYELDGVTADVFRTEARLDDVLRVLFDDYMRQYARDQVSLDWNGKSFDMDMIYHAFVEFMSTHGELSETDPVDRYETGWLDMVLSEVLLHDRVFYLKAQITIPASESVSVKAEFIKKPSFDFYTSGMENAGVYGYDMVTSLGTNLAFERTFAELIGPETIEITRQNFGFDVSANVLEVELDANIEHYYLEIRGITRDKASVD